MYYQDSWLKGRRIAKGYRECASRYEVVKEFCSSFDGPFSVLDVGANMCYFGLRLTEDFPDCRVLAFEFDHFDVRSAHVKRNKQNRLALFNHKLTIYSLETLVLCAHFDLILAMSVLHHVGGQIEDWVFQLKALSDNVIVELAGSDSPRAQKQINKDIKIRELGFGSSHLLSGFARPIGVLV